MQGEYLLVGKLAEIFAPIVAEKMVDIVGDVLKGWKNKENPPLGVCYFNPEPKEDYWELLQNACRVSSYVKILTATGYTTYGGAGTNRLADALKQKASGEIKFLLLDPEANDVVEKRIRELPPRAYNAKSYKGEIELATADLKGLKESTSLNISLVYFNHYPIWRVFIFNDIVAFVQPYLPGQLGDYSPAIAFKLTEETFSLFDFFLTYFDKTYDLGRRII